MLVESYLQRLKVFQTARENPPDVDGGPPFVTLRTVAKSDSIYQLTGAIIFAVLDVVHL